MTLNEIDAKSLDWQQIGSRLSQVLFDKNINTEELATNCGFSSSIIENIIKGRKYSSLNQLASLVGNLKINIEWLLYGTGNINDCNLPETYIIKRSAGLRKDCEMLHAEEGQHDGDLFEFIIAVEKFKKINHKQFPTLTECFIIMRKLGYKKTEHREINPLKGV